MPDQVRKAVDAIARQPDEDGWTLTTGAAEVIREGHAYNGVRVHVAAALATAKHEFHVDVSFGDPVVPDVTPVVLERSLAVWTLRGGRLEHAVDADVVDSS